MVYNKYPFTKTFVQGLLIMALFNCASSDNQNGSSENSKESIREPAVAGQFYPGSSDSLRKMVEGFLEKAEDHGLTSRPRILISPHAGYPFSGGVAAQGFSEIDKGSIRKVILLGPSHRVRLKGLSVPDADSYKTPLGRVRVNRDDIQRLKNSKLISTFSEAHVMEHSLEVQLPFLQVILEDFSIVPVLCGAAPEGAADLILDITDENTLIVISSDFSHYQSYKEAQERDKRSVNTILSMESDGFLDACGEFPIRIGMEIARNLDLEPKLLSLKNSHDTAPQYSGKDKVVGYASIAFTSKNSGNNKKTESSDNPGSDKYSEEEKETLLDLARSSLENAVKGESSVKKPENLTENMKKERGCFVTLTKNGQLRGCIGYLEGKSPLYRAVIENARNAALSDPRFPKVEESELRDIKIEISVLTQPEEIEFDTPEELLDTLVPHKDGLILKHGHKRSTYLPQVWEKMPDKLEFLRNLAAKSGSPADSWKESRFWRYRAVYFEED